MWIVCSQTVRKRFKRREGEHRDIYDFAPFVLTLTFKKCKKSLCRTLGLFIFILETERQTWLEGERERDHRQE